MPAHLTTGDIFMSPAQTLVNTVNTKGVMGKGIALEFKRRFPEMFRDYKRRCERGLVRVGEPYLYTDTQPWVLNFPTKDHWRFPSRLEWIRAGLDFFAEHYQEWGVESIAFPQLGTQNGGLTWDCVREVMVEALDPLDIEVLIYVYPGAQGAERGQRGLRGRSVASPEAVPAGRWDLDWLNRASEPEIRMGLKSIGLKAPTIKAFLEHRATTGAFRSVDAIQTKGLGPKSLDRIKDAIAGEAGRQISLFEARTDT